MNERGAQDNIEKLIGTNGLSYQ